MFIFRALFGAVFSSVGSFALAIIAFVGMAVYLPSWVRGIQQWAQGVENMVDFAALPDQAAILANLIIDDTSITLLVFILGAKFIVSLITALFKRD